MNYRREVDGLRALAVLPVILFHAGFTTFSGGYIGVDVFFVISGFLITGIIFEALKSGDFSLLNFYQRRAKRILPALFFVIAVSSVFAWFTLPPGLMAEFSESVLAAATYWSNIYFWRHSDYFATASELLPLLHTWSLSVEEQFYFLFPVFMIFMWRFLRPHILVAIAVFALLSLSLAQLSLENHQEAAFYLLPTRGWELLLGAYASILWNKKNGRIFKKSVSEILAIVGLAFILFSIFFYDKNTPFPALYALVPTVGTVLVLTCATSGTFVQRVLSRQILVSIGLISYSLYLWHQPVFAFARQNPNVYVDTTFMFLLCCAVLVMAYLTWRFVEVPFRKTEFLNGKPLLVSVFTGTMVCVVFGVVGNTSQGYSARSNVPAIVLSSITRSARQNECFYRNALHTRDDWLCDVGDEHVEPSFLVFGDSHAFSLLDVFDKAGVDSESHGFFVGAPGCIPLPDIYVLTDFGKNTDCKSLNDRVLEFLSDNQNIDTVILVARWSFYTEGGFHGNDWAYISKNAEGPKMKNESRQAFIFGLDSLLKNTRDRGVKLIVVKQVPQQLWPAKSIYFEGYKDIKNPLEIAERLDKFSVDLERNHRLRHFSDNSFALFDKMDEIEVVSFDHILCNDTKCPVGTADSSYYFDEDHLSVKGSMLIRDEIEKVLERVREG